MLYKKVSKQIDEWIDNGKEALLITEARQVGKSYLIRELLKDKKKEFVEFNSINYFHLFFSRSRSTLQQEELKILR